MFLKNSDITASHEVKIIQYLERMQKIRELYVEAKAKQVRLDRRFRMNCELKSKFLPLHSMH